MLPLDEPKELTLTFVQPGNRGISCDGTRYEAVIHVQ
jgi:hypothetical protein